MRARRDEHVPSRYGHDVQEGDDEGRAEEEVGVWGGGGGGEGGGLRLVGGGRGGRGGGFGG